MKKFVKIFLCAVMATVMLSVTACGAGTDGIGWHFFAPEEVYVSVGESYDLYEQLAIVELSEGPEWIGWIIEDEEILSIDENGVVTGLSEGVTTVFIQHLDWSAAKATTTVYVQ